MLAASGQIEETYGFPKAELAPPALVSLPLPFLFKKGRIKRKPWVSPIDKQ
jgi:hypothetical protein